MRKPLLTLLVLALPALAVDPNLAEYRRVARQNREYQKLKAKTDEYLYRWQLECQAVGKRLGRDQEGKMSCVAPPPAPASTPAYAPATDPAKPTPTAPNGDPRLHPNGLHPDPPKQQ